MTRNRPAALQTWLCAGERWALPAILLLAFALRACRLGDQNIWWDEGLAIWAVRKGLLGATLWTAQDVHPPLFFWTLWAWVRLAGESEFAARYITLGWGMLTVAAAYVLGARLGGRRAGLLAALLIAVARFHVWWSQEMRMYALAALAATLTLYAAVRWLDEERSGARRFWPMLYTCSAAACLYSIYLAALAPLLANVYFLVALARIPTGRRWRVGIRWLAAQVVALLVFVPWMLLALSRMRSWSVSEPFSFRVLLLLYSTLLTLGVSTNIDRYVPYLIPFALTLLGGLATLLWRRRPARPEPGLPGLQAGALLAGALVCLPLAVFVLTRPRTFFYTPRVEARYLVLFAPAFYVFLAWAIVRLGRRWLVAGLLALALCLGPMLAFLPGHYTLRYLRDDLQTMARLIAAHARLGDAILLISGDRYPLFTYYYERIVPPDGRIPLIRVPEAGNLTPDNVAPLLSAATANRERFWVAAVERGIQDPQNLSLPWLDQHFRRVWTYEMGYNALLLYGSGPLPPAVERDRLRPQYPLQMSADGLEFFGYDLPGHEYRAGDLIELGVYLAAEQPLRLTVEWRAADGELLQSLSQDQPATGQQAARLALRFEVWPSYRPIGTHFVLHWGPAEAPHSVRLAGPRLVGTSGKPGSQPIAQPLDVAFAEGISLHGFNLDRPLRDGRCQARPGDTLTLDLFWESSQPIRGDYTVFTHVVGSAYNPRTSGPVWGQHDGPPGEGRYPTSRWVQGRVVRDRHVIRLEPDTPPGDYELEIGLYSAATGQRLRVALPGGQSGEDRVVLGRVKVGD